VARTRLETVDLDLHPNEASDLLPLESKGILEAHGWDRAFWSVLDEGSVEDSMAVIGHRRDADDGDGSWETTRVRFRVRKRDRGRTEDAEACARHDGWVYVVGSHYGAKSGPIEAKRAFLARFREDEVEAPLGESKPAMEVAMNRFRLHRAVNDALAAFGPPLLGPGPAVRKRFIAGARKGAGKRTADRLLGSDAPINVEGAAFDGDGVLLLGLRYPVTADGNPILAEVSGVRRMFESRRAAPVVRRFWVLENAGTKRRPLGIRAVHRHGRDLHLMVGSLDASGKGSTLLEDHPEGGKASCAHYHVRLPRSRDGGAVEATLVHRFELPNVEGLAAGPRNRFFYVTDEDDRVHMRLMHHDRHSRSRRPKRQATSSTKRASRKPRRATRSRPKT
jgi:hypothetical protein